MSLDVQGRSPWKLAALGGVIAAVGAGFLCVGLTGGDAWTRFAEEVGALLFGWSGFIASVRAAVMSPVFLVTHHVGHLPIHAGKWLALGCGAFTLGLGLLATGLHRKPAEAPPLSEAAGAPLYPPLAKYRDFYATTLFAYGGGFLLSEVALIILQTLLGSSNKSGRFALPPTTAFGIALVTASVIAFVAGYLGASRARRLSAPEATIGILYFGLPIPLFLALILPAIPSLQLSVGLRLREVTYVADLLGRPELAYALVFGLLALMMVLGITSGFVATASGRTDLRVGFELFIAERHVNVLRPRLLLAVFGVLVTVIIPPVLIFAILRAAETAVDRTRIRKLGLRDPLLASHALHEAKLKEQSPTAMMTALSMLGVGVGVMFLIIVLSVMSGFESDLQKKILGTNAHAVVTAYADSIPDYAAVMKKVGAVPGIIGQTPFIMNEVMISSEQNVAGVVIKGIDPATVGDVTDLPNNVKSGSMDNLVHPENISQRRLSPEGGPIFDNDPVLQDRKSARPTHPADDDVLRADSVAKDVALPGILLGRELAGNLRVGVGDRINIVSPLGGGLGPNGPIPKEKAFQVAGVFATGMYEYDTKFVYILLTNAEKFFNVKGATGIELKVNDVDDARRIASNVLKELDGYPYRVRDWGDMNRNLFSALRTEKLVMGLILSSIVIVAAGLIVATMIMLVLEKRKEIAVLKALGVSDGSIVKIFVAEGLQIGICGALLGLVSGLAWSLIIGSSDLFKLDPEVYYIPNLPVKIEPLQTALAVVIAILVTFLASVYPALKASRLEPVEGLKAE